MRTINSEEIQRRRKEKGWSCRDLARRVKIFDSTLYGIEKGQYKTSKFLSRIAEALDCKLKDITLDTNPFGTCLKDGCNIELTSPMQKRCEKHALESQRKNARTNSQNSRKKTVVMVEKPIPDFKNETVELKEVVDTGVIPVEAIANQAKEYEGKMPTFKAKGAPKYKREYNGFYDCSVGG